MTPSHMKVAPMDLFGFVGVPAEARIDANRLRIACVQQLASLFGPQAAEPIELILKDWAQDGFTASPLDRKSLMQACSHLHMYVSMRISVRMYTSARIYKCAYVRMHVCICIHSGLFYSHAICKGCCMRSVRFV